MKKSFQNQTFAEKLPDAILVIDKHYQILWWNYAAEQLFMFDSKPYDLPYITDFIDRLKHSQGNSIELDLKLPRKKTSTVSVTRLEYDANNTLLLIRDITKLHILERMRQDFVANVSHELRTPLTVIHGYLDVLIQQYSDDSELAEVFQQMYSQSSRMEKVIEDLLMLSRLETDIVDENKGSIVVANMLEKICQDARRLSGDKCHNIKVKADSSITLTGNEKELHSAFSNLIFNAVHYTPDEGKILVECYKKANKAYLQVSDSGIGIDKKHIPRLTERFYRVDKARSRDSGGTGLGLAIVKHVLIRHQADLIINSEPGKGSMFTCVFSLNL